MEHTKYLIVGGGITGLAFAAALDEDEYLLCEAEHELGGYCRTVKQDGFVWDYSGHFFHFRHKDIEQQLVQRIGAENVRTIEKRALIHWKGDHVDFPFQKNIHQLPQAEFIDCLVGLFERPEATPENFEQMLYAKFGKGISERFLIPYNEKLYATSLQNLDVDAMGRFFPYADVPDIIKGFRASDNRSYNSTFTYPAGGAIEYVNAIAQDVKESALRLNTTVTGIDLKTRVATTTNGQIGFEYLISAAPFPKLLGMCGVNFDPTVYTRNKVLIFNLGFDRKGPRNVHWIYYPQRELSFYRLGFYDNIFDTDRLSMYVEIGFPADEALPPARVTQLREQVLADLASISLIDEHQLVSSHHIVLDPAYVHITQRSNADVREKKEILATRGVYSLGRYGSWTYCSIEDNILEARALAARFNALP